ncbi:MAG TPA: type II toxin-antitoxin system prevent-host-death family antitoxin, partial [Candidatus Dormibacteraeota bacterium]|nr:type II toxin-antitoxin system prevent-host-death family antitoxin [Candidatus Dormibacteraeota bacterium]
IEEVRGGETVIVTKNGAPVAKIVPIGSDDDTERAAAMQSILGSTIALAPLTIRELVDEGRHH